MNVHFILVEPTQSGNVGAAARAIKTMGFSKLHIVGGSDHVDDTSKKMAYGSHDVLHGAQKHPTLNDALKHMDFVIGTTAKERTGYHDFFDPEQARHLVETKHVQNLALVFGREDRGLESNEIAQCDLLSKIELAAPYPSINLSQSIMIYAYVFGMTSKPSSDFHPPQADTQRILKNKALKMLKLLKIDKKDVLHRRILERLMQINEDDTHLFLSFHRYLSRNLNNLQ